MEVSDESYQLILESTQMGSLGLIWENTTNYPANCQLPEHYSESYEKRIELLLIVLKKLLDENDICFTASNGVFLTNTHEEQLTSLKYSMPKEEVMNKIGHYWWYLDECPVRLVWIRDINIPGLAILSKEGKFYYNT